MRRWLTAVALAGVAALSLTGCANPAGVDGELTDDWMAMAEPKPFTPEAGVCLAEDFADTAYLSSYRPVDCTVAHKVETVAVETFTGGIAQRATPPGRGTEEIRTAYGACDRKATEYVGAEWRSGRLWLGVAVPSVQAWSGGARWFRCDLVEVKSVEDDGDTVSRTTSLKDVLKSASPLSLGCYAVKLDSSKNIDTMPTTDCGKTHNSEFVGVWKSTASSYPTSNSDWTRYYDECRKLVAKYVGVPNDGDMKYRTGVVALPGGKADWDAGNRGVRCYLWLSSRKLTKSLKGAGTRELPIQYA
jgi:hypothetical protein